MLLHLVRLVSLTELQSIPDIKTEIRMQNKKQIQLHQLHIIIISIVIRNTS